jgi:hypothetical protein
MGYFGTIPGLGRGEIKRMMEGVNSTLLYCENICKYHNVPQHNKKMYFSKTKSQSFMNL